MISVSALEKRLSPNWQGLLEAGHPKNEPLPVQEVDDEDDDYGGLDNNTDDNGFDEGGDGDDMDDDS